MFLVGVEAKADDGEVGVGKILDGSSGLVSLKDGRVGVGWEVGSGVDVDMAGLEFRRAGSVIE